MDHEKQAKLPSSSGNRATHTPPRWCFLAFILQNFAEDQRTKDMIIPKEVVAHIIKMYRGNYWSRGIVDYANLKCILTFGSHGSGAGELGHPRGIVLNSNGDIIVAEHDNARLSVFDARGNFIRHFQQKFVPLGLAIDEADNIYIADNNGSQVTVLSKEGNVILQFGKEAGIRDPWGVQLNEQNEIFVTDNTHRIYHFSPTGELINTFGQCGTGPGDVKHPRGLCFSPEGELHVVDLDNRRVQIYSQDGHFIRGFGSKKIFESPRDIAIDESGNIFVGDSSHRFQVFSSDGNRLGSFGAAGRDPGFLQNPMGICFRHGVVYVSDYDNSRVQVFASDK